MALKSARLEIYIYSGTAGSYNSSDLKYTLDKDLISGQTNIIFEIGNLVRDYLTHDFNNDYASVTKWVSIVKRLFDTNTDLEFTSGSSVVSNFIALDGFGTFEDEINPQLSTNALISADNIYINF